MTGRGVDGRVARRERNRDAALDAAFELFVERRAIPTTDEVAARSGVSARSLYRYFPEARQLHLAALARRISISDPYFVLDRVGEGGLEERIAGYVDQRIGLYEYGAALIRAAYAVAADLPEIGKQVARRKQLLADQARRHFAAELDPLPASTAESVLACVEVLCQFEALETLRVERGLSAARTRDALVVGLRAVLTTHG